jgi:alpha-N-acetylglucosaminidase
VKYQLQTPEATETNPVMYDFVMDMAWKPVGPVRNISLWVEKYSHRRYGVDMETTKTAWNFLRKSVYGSTDVQEGTTGSVIAARPSFNMSRVGCCASVNMYWDPEDVRKALLYFIYASGGVKTETFLNDLAEVCRQVLSDRAWEYYQKLGQAFEARDVAAFEAFATQFKAIIASTDKILRTRKIFLLSNWLDAARSHSNESLSQNWLELNARTQITVWGGPSLSEYVTRRSIM